MGNLLNNVKRFLSNKNTVTILGIILGVIVLYIGYNWRVNQAITLVTVPTASTALGSRQVITEDDIEMREIPQSMINESGNIITNKNDVIGKFVNFGTSIPMHSVFYDTSVIEESEMPDSAFGDIPKDYTIYSLGVDLHTTYGNSIFPGNFIDLYLKATDETGKVIFGKFIESIEVLAVKDDEGNHVFESTVENRTPSELLFAVPDDMYLLLMKAGYIDSADVEIIPVPRNSDYSAEPGDTLVSSDYIRDFILAKTTILPENEVVIEENQETENN